MPDKRTSDFPNKRIKEILVKQIDAQQRDLIDLSLKIHDSPEIAFKEKKAYAWLTSFLKTHGFRIKRGISGLSTAFQATYGSGRPSIALMAEYDALPEIGHGCGHNLIAASAIGAGVACKETIDQYGGTIIVFGTPGEEMMGGKAIMADAGAFNDVDIAMMVHPGVKTAIMVDALACVTLYVEYFGLAAHAASHPEKGINALDAMVLAFNGINALRQHLKGRARLHGIITHGGEAANVIPAYTAAELIVRAQDGDYLKELQQRVLDCLEGAALATGTKMKYRWGDVTYLPMKNNHRLAGIFAKNITSLGIKVEPLDSRFGFGSTDMGNVSQIVPSIHPSIAIAEDHVVLHTDEFAEAAVSEAGHKGMINAAKAMAMTVVDLLIDTTLVRSVQQEFKSKAQNDLYRD
jgi:amidohydrolase